MTVLSQYLFINLACLSISQFVCFYPINVKTAEPIRPIFLWQLTRQQGIFMDGQNKNNTKFYILRKCTNLNQRTLFLLNKMKKWRPSKQQLKAKMLKNQASWLIFQIALEGVGWTIDKLEIILEFYSKWQTLYDHWPTCDIRDMFCVWFCPTDRFSWLPTYWRAWRAWSEIGSRISSDNTGKQSGIVYS